MQPCHTHGHAIPLVNLRSLGADASSSSQLCAGVTRAVQAVLQQPAHVFITCLVILWRPLLSFAMKRRNTPFARRRAPQLFLHVHPWQPLSASNGGVEAYDSGLACVLYSFATHLARTWSFPDCLLSVSTLSVLMGAFPVSRRHVSLSGNSRVHLVMTNVLHLLPSGVGAQPSHPPSVSSKLSNVDLFLCFSRLVNNPAYPVCIICFLALFPRLQLQPILSQLFLQWSSNFTYQCS